MFQWFVRHKRLRYARVSWGINSLSVKHSPVRYNQSYAEGERSFSLRLPLPVVLICCMLNQDSSNCGSFHYMDFISICFADLSAFCRWADVTGVEATMAAAGGPN